MSPPHTAHPPPRCLALLQAAREQLHASRSPLRRLGAAWGDKKSICNKFTAGSPIASIAWPANRPGELVWGCANGSVWLGSLASGRTVQLYAHPDASGVVSVAAAATEHPACCKGPAPNSAQHGSMAAQQRARMPQQARTVVCKLTACHLPSMVILPGRHMAPPGCHMVTG